MGEPTAGDLRLGRCQPQAHARLRGEIRGLAGDQDVRGPCHGDRRARQGRRGRIGRRGGTGDGVRLAAGQREQQGGGEQACYASGHASIVAVLRLDYP